MTSYHEAGIVSALIGNICFNLAVNIQSHAKRQLVTFAVNGFPQVKFRDRLWWLGVVLLLSSEASSFIAYGLAPASVVSPLGVFALISNCIIPPLIFDEMPHIQTITGTVVALPGILLLILAAPDLQVPVDGPALGPGANGYVISNLIALAILSLCRINLSEGTTTHFFVNIGGGALMGSISALSAKGLSLSIFSHRSEINAPTCLLTFLVGAILQISILLETLRFFPMWQVVPHHFVAYTALMTLGSCVIFQEFSISTTLAKVQFGVGSLLSVAGVCVAAKPHEHKEQAPALPAATSRPRHSIVSKHNKVRAVLAARPLPNWAQRARYSRSASINSARIERESEHHAPIPSLPPPVPIPPRRGAMIDEEANVFSPLYAEDESYPMSPGISPHSSVPCDETTPLFRSYYD